MTYVFHLGIGLLIMVCQTTLPQYVGLFEGLYDLIIVQIIYLGLYRPLRESLFVLGLFGVMMDGLTGGSYGLYLTTYIWIFLCVRWALTLFQLSNTMITPFVVVFGVLIENMVHLIGTLSVGAVSSPIVKTGLDIVIIQIIWALFTGPFLLLAVKKLYQYLFQWQRRFWMTGNSHI